MKKQAVQFWTYLTQLFKKWVFWLSIVPTIVDSFSFYFFKISIDPIFRLLFAVIAIIWSGFEVYKDTLKKIPRSKKLEQHLDISVRDGQGYKFEVIDQIASNVRRDDNKGADEYRLADDSVSLPLMKLTINGRIKNDGDIPLVILRINGFLDPVDPFSFSGFNAKILPDINSPETNVITIEPEQTYFFTITTLVNYGGGGNNMDGEYNDLQVAARIKPILANNIVTKSHIFVESHREHSSEKPKKEPELTKEINLRELCDELIRYWKELGETDLLKLANERRIVKSPITRPKR